MRKGYTKLTQQDFEDYPIWEIQGLLTMATPYKGVIPFKADKSRAYFVRTTFVLADKTKMKGWTMVCVPPYEVASLNPTILTDDGPVGLTRLAKQPKEKDVEDVWRKLGKDSDKVFPLKFQTDVSIPKGPAKDEMDGFFHRLSYLNDNGWDQHVDFYYKTASELEAATRKFEAAEAERKTALEPTKDEKALLKAAKNGDVIKLVKLLAKGTNVNRGGTFPDRYGTRKNITALMLAAEVGHSEIIKILLKAGASVHSVDETNEARLGLRTPLAYACLGGHLEVAKILLEADSDPNHQLYSKHTILDDVSYEGSIEMVKLLLEFGGNPNASCTRTDYFALERAVAGRRLEVVKLLLAFKANINGANEEGETALIRASRMLEHEIVRYLLEKGADVSHKTLGKLTALHSVIITASDIDPDHESGSEGKFALALAVVKSLVESGANVNATTKYGDKPLTLAKGCRFSELTAYLVSKGAKG